MQSNYWKLLNEDRLNDVSALSVTAPILGPVANATLAAASSLTAAESGETYFLSSATEFVTTLPAPAAG